MWSFFSYRRRRHAPSMTNNTVFALIVLFGLLASATGTPIDLKTHVNRILLPSVVPSKFGIHVVACPKPQDLSISKDPNHPQYRALLDKCMRFRNATQQNLGKEVIRNVSLTSFENSTGTHSTNSNLSVDRTPIAPHMTTLVLFKILFLAFATGILIAFLSEKGVVKGLFSTLTGKK